MRTYAAAQHVGGRSHQCDATAVRRDSRTGALALAILDGIGSSDSVRDFSRTMAVRLARSGARHGDADTALRDLHARIAAEPGRPDTWGILPSAAALVAVSTPPAPSPSPGPETAAPTSSPPPAPQTGSPRTTTADA